MATAILLEAHQVCTWSYINYAQVQWSCGATIGLEMHQEFIYTAARVKLGQLKSNSDSYIGSYFFLIASGTIRSSAWAAPPKLKPCPCHAPNHASWLCGVYSNFNEHRENTRKTKSVLQFRWHRCSVASVGVPRRVATYVYAWTKHSSGTIYIVFRDPGKILKIQDCSGHSRTVGVKLWQLD